MCVCVCVLQQFSHSTRTKHVVDHIKQGRKQSKNHNAPQSTSRFLCAYCKFKGSTSGYDMQAVSSSNNNNKKEKLKQNIDINKRERKRESSAAAAFAKLFLNALGNKKDDVIEE